MGVVAGRVFANSYRDSVELMQIAAAVEGRDGIERAGLVMATPANRDVLAAAGLLFDAVSTAGPNDLVIAVFAADDATATAALDDAAARLAGSAGSTEDGFEGDSPDRRDHRRGGGRRRGHEPRPHLDARAVRHRRGDEGAQARPQRLPVQRQRPGGGRDRAEGDRPRRRGSW